jgi:hypothetical protein
MNWFDDVNKAEIYLNLLKSEIGRKFILIAYKADKMKY